MMTLNRGKFYKDGKVVPPEFGNKEQIAIMKRVTDLQEGVNPRSQIECPCGRIVTLDEEYADTLCECGNEFTLDYNQGVLSPILKLTHLSR